MRLLAWDFELSFHELFNESERALAWERSGRWRDPCDAFQCEQPQCDGRYIRYVNHISVPLQSGHSRKKVDPPLLSWEEEVTSCNVIVTSLGRRRRAYPHCRSECEQLRLQPPNL